MSLYNVEDFLGNTHAVCINNMAADLARFDETASKGKRTKQVILAGRKAMRVLPSFKALRGLHLLPRGRRAKVEHQYNRTVTMLSLSVAHSPFISHKA